jgi:ElaB/YqjD/DUF883 family membrane-anchored ribosome-binding protein
MITNANSEHSDNFADRTAASTNHAIKSAQFAVNGALDSLADTVQDLGQLASPQLDRASAQANALGQRGVDHLRNTSQHLRESAHHTSESARGYVRDEPIKSVLIAAAAGAVLMALVNLLGHSRNRL